MQLALIFPDDDGPDLQAPHGLGPLLGNRGEQLSQRGRESPESLFLQEMGERSGDQVLGQGRAELPFNQWLVALIGRTAALPSVRAAMANAAVDARPAQLPERQAERISRTQ
jgi:hypothetical protein